MPSLGAYQRGDMAAIADRTSIGSRPGVLEPIVMPDHLLDEVDLGQGGGIRIDQPARDVDRPELCPDATFEQSRDIGMEPVEVTARIGPSEIAIDLGSDPPGQIVVPVDDGQRLVNRPGGLGDHMRKLAGDHSGPGMSEPFSRGDRQIGKRPPKGAP